MAARLNSPADFMTTKGRGSLQPQLLPPSTFEQPRSDLDDPWKALAKATNDIMQLKQENQKLRDERQISFPAGEEIKARVDIHQVSQTKQYVPPQTPQPPPPSQVQPVLLRPDTTHYDEIINRQAAEISELRKKLSMEEAGHQKILAKMESQLVITSTKTEHQLEALKQEIDRMKETHADETRKKVEHYERLLKEQSSTMETLEDELRTASLDSQKEITDLRNRCKDTQEQLQDAQEKYREEICIKDSNIEQLQKQMTQLKNYITESEETSKSTDSWRRDIESLQNKQQKLEKEKINLKSTVDLLNIRLDSQNKILILQEEALSKVKEETTAKQKQALLTRWREKVLCLMVQQKSDELMVKEEERKMANKVYMLGQQLESSQTECQRLKHSLENSTAQLELERNQVMILQGELTQAQELALTLDNRIQEDTEAAQALAKFAYGIYQNYEEMETTLQHALSMQKACNRRVAFASGRVEMLQSQFARKEALLKLEMAEVMRENPTHDYEETPVSPLGSHQAEQLQQELDHVTVERDRLADQVKHDAQMLESKIQAARTQYADEVVALKHRLEELHQEIEEKNQKCDHLSTALEDAQVEVDEAHNTIMKLKTDLAKQQLQESKALETQKSENEAKHIEQLAAMEHRLNEARREHTKAVVSLRQLERQTAREREQMSEQLQKIEDHYKGQLENLELKLRNMEKDRNLLMVTLKQEGLVGKAQAQRAAPMRSEAINDSDLELSHDLTAPNSARSTGEENKGSQQEPFHSVIDDLKSLTAAVMEDNASGEGDQDRADT